MKTRHGIAEAQPDTVTPQKEKHHLLLRRYGLEAVAGNEDETRKGHLGGWRG